jgi:hypothetical protein
MYWYKITLSSDDLEDMRSIDLMSDVGRRIAQEGYPPDFALFLVADGRVNGATYYLPPSAVEICPGVLTDFDALAAAMPEKESLKILVGESDAMDHWFTNGEPRPVVAGRYPEALASF